MVGEPQVYPWHVAFHAFCDMHNLFRARDHAVAQIQRLPREKQAQLASLIVLAWRLLLEGGTWHWHPLALEGAVDALFQELTDGDG